MRTTRLRVRNPKRLSRREVLTAMGIGAAGAILGCPTVLRAQPATLTVTTGGGALEEAYKIAYFQPFQAKTGIQIRSAPYMDPARVKAMVDNNAADVDVLAQDGVEAAVLGSSGLLQPIDYGVVDKSSLIPEAPQEYFVLADVAALVMAWSSRTVTAATRPQTWKDYFDAASRPGQRSLYKAATQSIDVAAMGGGQPRQKLYPIDIDLALHTLDKIKPNLTWWSSGAQAAQLLIDGEVDFGTAWNGRLFKPQKAGAKIGYTFDEALYTTDAMIVPKGSKNAKWGMEFIAFMMEAPNQAAFSRAIPYGPVNKKALDLLDRDTLALLPNSPENGKTGVFQNLQYWAEHGSAIADRFNKWLLT